MFPRPGLAPLIALAFFLSSIVRAQPSGSIAITGPFLPGMDRVDATMTALMAKYNSPGGQLAVLRNGRLVLARGYGIGDREAGVAVQPDSLFRIASLTKFATATAILTLVEQGKLSLDAKVFALIPELTPLPGATVDPRIANITVRQLLQHTGGWDRDASGDPMFNSTAIAAAAGTPAPASAETVIRYMLGRPLDFDPGTRYVYSNFGYDVLGRIIEKLSGQSYPAYVQTAVFAKAGISRIVQGRSLFADRAAGEVRYYDYPNAPLSRSVFPPTTALVPTPYGGFYLEAMDSHGAWIANAIDYVRLFAALDGSRPPALLNASSITALTARPAPPISVGAAAYYGLGLEIRPNAQTGASGTRANWWHGGTLVGTVTWAVRLANGWTWAAFFNTRPQGTAASDAFQTEIDSGINAALSAITPPATGDLFASATPQILTPPAAQKASPGDTVTLSVSATSVTAPAYQWLKDSASIAGATTPTLTLNNLTAASAGAYSVVVTNAAGATTSSPASVSVGATSTAGRLINLSILTALTGSGDTLTMGYVVGGAETTGTKPLVIRAAGPSLGALGVPGTLDDPKLELFAGGARTGENDNWGGSPTLASAMAGVGAFAYMSATSKDAAVTAAIPAGDNSVKVSGTGSGTVIAELYDATPAENFTVTTPRLINVSVLKNLGSGLTAGFVIGGAGSVRVLVRAVGPTLGAAPFNVPGAVADPQLSLFNGATKIGENDDWGGTAALTAAFNQVGAFALPPNSKDAALLADLVPGSYSVQVNGVGNTTGVAIVEIYEVR